MARLSIKLDTIRALFARSGNRCAFPGCTSELINEKNQFIAQICHIEAADTKGERFNIDQSDEQRRQYENLILLCYPHHIETNDTDSYPVKKLKEMKWAHEAAHDKDLFKIDESLLYKITQEMTEYWSEVEQLNTKHIVDSELAFEIDMKATYLMLAQQASALLGDTLRLRDYLIASDNELYADLLKLIASLGLDSSVLDAHVDKVRPFKSRNWDVLNIGFTNTVSLLRVALIQMEIKYLEEYLKINSNEPESRERLKALKSEFRTIASYSGYVD